GPDPGPVGTATERFPAIADEPAPRTADDTTDDTAEPDSPPGARLLPPLPPGVSDSSGWAPPWRR
ncbi:hypothetical protein DEF24_02000, partial [Marinitenerispora sediminis]